MDSEYEDGEPGAPQAEDFIEMLALCRRFAFPEPIVDGVLEHLKSRIVWGKNTLVLIAEAYRLDFPKLVKICLSKVTQDLKTVKNEFAALQEETKEMVPANVFQAKRVVNEQVLKLRQSAPAPKPEVKSDVYGINGHRRTLCKAEDLKAAVAKIDKHAQAGNDLWAFLSGEMSLSMQSLVSNASGPSAEAEQKQ